MKARHEHQTEIRWERMEVFLRVGMKQSAHLILSATRFTFATCACGRRCEALCTTFRAAALCKARKEHPVITVAQRLTGDYDR